MLKFAVQSRTTRLIKAKPTPPPENTGSVASSHSSSGVSRDSDFGSASLDVDNGSVRSDNAQTTKKKTVSFEDTIHFIESPHDSSSGIASDDHNQSPPGVASDGLPCGGGGGPRRCDVTSCTSTSGSDSSLSQPRDVTFAAAKSRARDRRRTAPAQYDDANAFLPPEVTSAAVRQRRLASTADSASGSDSSGDSWTPAAATRPRNDVIHPPPPSPPSPFARLPDAVLSRVLAHLPLSAYLCRVARVSRRWYRLAWDPRLWRSVRLAPSTARPDAAVRLITRRLSYHTPGVCVTLEALYAAGCSRLTDRTLDCLARRCPELRALDVSGCEAITNIALFDVLSGCVNLQQLLVAGCVNITCLGLAPQAALQARDYGGGQQTALRSVDLSDCPRLDDAGLQLLGAACARLERVHVRRCPRVGDAGVGRLVAACAHLREVSVSECERVGDASARHLARLGDRLRYVSVANTRVGSAGLRALAARCRQLRYVNARGCAGVDDAAVVALARQCARLKALDVGRCNISDTSLRAIATHCARMRKLGLCGCTSLSDAGVAALAGGCPLLEQLNVQECPRLSVDAFRAIRSQCHRCIVEHTTVAFF